MSVQINQTAPDFEADTTEGRIRFHEWIGDSWAVLFSHPKDFTPVCTTELGYMAQIKPEFDRRGVKVIGLSVDPMDRHADWVKDIGETQGTEPNFPIISDVDFAVSKAYGMLPASVEGDPLERTPADNQTVRNVFVIGPDKKVKLDPRLPDDDRSQLRRGAAGDRLAAADGQPQGGHARAVAARPGRDHRRLAQQRAGQGDLARGLEGAQALHPDRAPARSLSPAQHPSPSTRQLPPIHTGSSPNDGAPSGRPSP